MDKKLDEERWDEDEEEALSLCDLPLIHQPRKDKEEQENDNSLLKETQLHQDDFDFCSMFKQESEMCAADVVFFQGQILPHQRHSISSERDLSLQRQQHYKQQRSHKISSASSRSESMGHHSCYSRSLVSSSRSSSINSSSASSTSTNALPKQYSKPKPSPLPGNQFQYNQPSPSPRLTKNKKETTNCSMTCNNKSNHDHINPKKLMSPSSSSPWNTSKLGLVTTPPEILYARPCCNNINFRSSHNSTSCTNSSFSGSFGKKKNANKQIKAGLFGGGCKCSITSVDDPLRASRIAVKMMKRSGSENESIKSLSDDDRDEEDENNAEMMRYLKMRKKKQLASYYRTSEWLKQLSIEDRNNDDLS